MTCPQEGSDDDAVVASRTDPERFAELFQRRAGEIYRYHALRAGRAMAEELTADTFARAFDARWRFDPGRGTAKAWLYGIATNVVRLHRRVEGRKQRAYARVAACVGVDEGPEARVADGSTVREVLGRLPSREIDVVLLVAGAGLTYEEAAHALGVPVGTVRSRYSRARRRVSALAPGRK